MSDNLYISYRDYGDEDTNRSILCNISEGDIKSHEEREYLRKYKKIVALLKADKEKLQEIRSLLRDSNNPFNASRNEGLQNSAIGIEKQIELYEKKLIDLEQTAPLQRVLQEQKVKFNFKETLHLLLTKAKSFLKRLFFFSVRKIKVIVIFTSVCAFLFIASLIIHNIYDSLMDDALYHYELTKTSYTMGCGEYYCKYCEGANFSEYSSPYSFRYYRKISNIRTAFEGIASASLIVTIASLALLISCLIYKHKNKSKQHEEQELKSQNPSSATNLERRFCKYCGMQIDTDSVFCSCCGKNITKSNLE